MGQAGYGAVGEFHYVHHQPDGTPYEDRNEMALTVAEAAIAAGFEIVMLPAAYHRNGWDGEDRPPVAGQLRFCDPDVETFLSRVDELRTWASSRQGVSVGVAAHSVRAVPDSWLSAIAEYAEQQRDRAPRSRARAASRAGGVSGGARLLADRAARADRLPRPTRERDPRNPCLR